MITTCPAVTLGQNPLQRPELPAQDRLLLDGVLWTGLRNTEGMPPFFTTSVGDNDVWLFAGSNGALCAGRRDPDQAFFPYQTVDKILDQARSAGMLSCFHIINADGSRRLWEPWSELPALHPRQRSLFKHPEGNGLCFEEHDLESDLVFRCVLATCNRFGLVRQCLLQNRSKERRAVQGLDGWHRIIPPGINAEMWRSLSNLAQAYMRHDRVPGLPLGIFTLNAAITDRAEPMEVLRAACAWSSGLAAKAPLLLSTRQVPAFRLGHPLIDETEIRGETGAFLCAFDTSLEPGQTHTWYTGIDTGLDHASLIRLKRSLASNAQEQMLAFQTALDEDRRGLRARLESSDGLAKTGDLTGDEHHLSNTLFNIMRGGVLPPDLRLQRDDFLRWLKGRDRVIAAKHLTNIQSWPDSFPLDQLLPQAQSCRDAQLERLANLYLPLSFSRRHGDPSRPWNRFSIRLRDDKGQPLIAWQGNWRDIFQNWEALALSFPSALPGMICNFLDASSADGYNPYRITSEGVDWEVPEPDNPWAHHGFWGDHQIVYLQRLLTLAHDLLPGWIEERLPRRLHASVDIPYRIRSLVDILQDPRNTVLFDEARHADALARERERGTDARLLRDAEGEPLLVSMAEKLLVPVLAKLSNLVPEGGIWLNTQRPEWNDANNALVGYGLSMVTVCQLRRHLCLLQTLFEGERLFPCTDNTAAFLRLLSQLLGNESGHQHWSDSERLSLLLAFGAAGEQHRNRVYAGHCGPFVDVSFSEVRHLLASALALVDASIESNRRPDGLFHSYNLLELQPGSASIARLQPMLEGQVAVLGSGFLNGEQALALLESLRNSALYRENQHSYVLYPDRRVPSFLERNTLPASTSRLKLVQALLGAGDQSLLSQDEEGGLHFAADLGNARDLDAALDDLASQPRLAPLIAEERAALQALWEQVFSHKSFLGRSGTMFAFEGLGSIYWHMVSKLLLAVQECHEQAASSGVDDATISGLAARYLEVRGGLGPSKSPAEFGAFPTDPYSHTPGHRGAQQPGMTGQVKEELLARRGELGVRIQKGCLCFEPRLLRRSEFLSSKQVFSMHSPSGRLTRLELDPDSLAFSICQVPVVYKLGGRRSIELHHCDGSRRLLEGSQLDAEASSSVLHRTDVLSHVVVHLGDLALL